MSTSSEDADRIPQQDEIDAETAASAAAMAPVAGAGRDRHLGREAGLGERERRLDDRETGLDDREAGLDERDAAQDRGDDALERRELLADQRDQDADQREINAQTAWSAGADRRDTSGPGG